MSQPAPSVSEPRAMAHPLANHLQLRRRAWPIVFAYASAATLWIYFSDQALAVLLPTPDLLIKWSVYKGLGFVAVTSVVLLFMLRWSLGQIETAYGAVVVKELQLRASEAQLSDVVTTAMDAIVTVNAAQRIQIFNPAAQRIFGCNESQALHQPIRRFLPTLPDDVQESRQLVLSGLRWDGTELPIEASVSWVPGLGGAFMTAILRDISQRVAHEAEIERLRRLYNALSQVNQAIVWAKTTETLFERVCHVLVEHGGFQIAWIGIHDMENDRIVAVAQHGVIANELSQFGFAVNELPRFKAFDNSVPGARQPFVCNDLRANSATSGWCSKVLSSGARAGAVFIIERGQRPFAALIVCADVVDFFQEQEVALLAEAALDVSYALDNITKEQARCDAEVALEHEKHFSDTMIESMPGIVYFYDSEGRFLRWNKNFERVSGFSAAEISTMHPRDFFMAQDQAVMQARIAEVIAHGESSLEAPLLSKDGSTTPYYFTGTRVNYGGRPCLVGVGVDASQQKQAQEALFRSELRYRTTLDNILESCQLIGFDWAYLYLNKAAAIGNRRPNSELLGKKLPEAWPGIENTPIFVQLQRCMEQRKAFQGEVEFTFMDGSSGWFDVHGEPAPEGIFVLSIDITEQRRAQCALRELNAELENKVAQRTEQLHAALLRAEAADQIKSAFLATMSHELRTPLNSIIGFTGILLQAMAGPLNAEQEKQLGMVRNSARHLLALINDILDLSKIEAGQLEVKQEPMNVAASIERVVTSMRTLAERRNLILEVSIAPDVELITSDRRRLEQILLNLLSNAIKFTDVGSVRLSIRRLANFQGPMQMAAVPALQFVVQDTGIGIKREDLEKLFEPFYQVDTGLSRRHEGTGLGLAICRRLTDLLGGEITARSQWMEGSEFVLVLPLHGVPRPHEPHHPNH